MWPPGVTPGPSGVAQWGSVDSSTPRRLLPSDKVVILLPLLAVILLTLLGTVAWRVWQGFNPPDFATFKVFEPHLAGTSGRVTVTIDRVTVQPEWEAKSRTYPTGRQGPFRTRSGQRDVVIEGIVHNGEDENLLLLTLEYAALETESGEVRLSVAAWGPDGERTFCEGHAGQVSLAPGESVPYSASVAPQSGELREPTVGEVEDGVLPPWRFAGMAYGQCRQTALELLGTVRFEAANLGEPAVEDYYPFGPPSCNFTGDIGPNGRPYWVPPGGLPETGCE